MRALPGRQHSSPGARSAFVGFNGLGGLSSLDPCRENFWSAACWFGSQGSQALGIDSGPGTINVTPPPTSACAGTIGVDANGKWTCTQVAGVNDKDNTQGQLSTNGEDFQQQWNDWIERTRASANVPESNTAGSIFGTGSLTGSSPLWLLGIAGVAILFFSKGGR